MRSFALTLLCVLAAALSAVPGRAVEWTMTEFFWDPQHWEHIRWGGGSAKLEGTSAVWQAQGGAWMYYDGARRWNLNALAGATNVYDADLSGGNVVFRAEMWPGVEYYDRIYLFSGGRLSVLAEGPHGYWGSLGEPRISGSNIVWSAGTAISYPVVWNRAIYEYDGRQVLQISPPRPAGGGDSRLGPLRISGSNVVWAQWTSQSGGDLVLYDGQTTRPIAHSEGDFWSEYDVSGSNVVWTDMVAGERQVFLYDGHTTKQISQNPPCGDTGDAPPRIDGNRVVWDWHGTVGDNADTYYVYYYDGTDLRRLARDPDAWDAGDYRPFVSGSNVAWSAWIHGPIMFYDGSNVVEFPADGEVLALSGSSILFSRGGVVLATATPEPSTMALLAAGGACAAVLAWRRRARHRAAQVMRRTKRQAAPGRPAGTTRRAAFALSAVLAAALSAVPGRAVEWTMTEFFWDPQHWEHIRGGGPAKLEGTSAVWRTQGGTQMYYDGTRLWNLNALAGATSVYDADLSGGKVVFKAQMWPGVEYFDRIYQFSGGRLSILAEGPHGYWGSLGNPRISGSNIVWTAGTPISYPDLWNRAIYEYDGHQPMQIAPPQPWGRGIDSHLGQPLISGSNVVWSQWTSESGGDLLLYDGQTTRTIAHRAYDFWPDYALSGSNVVWTDMVGGDRQIFLYDGQTTTQISQNPPGGDTGDYPPRIDGNRVVWDWHGTVGDNADTYYVYYYDDTGLGRLARDPSGEDPSDCRPFVSGRNVAWSAWENGPIMFYDGSNIVELPCSGDVLAVSGHNILFSRGGAIALATATPEPGTVALFAAGSALLAVLAWVRRMRERNND